MNPRISCHIIAKETTALGKLFFSCCLQALLDSNWPDEIIIVNNGCSADVLDMVREKKKLFNAKGVVVGIGDAPGSFNYSQLRNMALQATDPKSTIFHWVDTDEIYFPDQLDSFKIELCEIENFSQAFTYFYHFIFDPWTWQFKGTKDNIFAWSPDVIWTKGVHEKVANIPPGQKIQTQIEYLHLGYLRPQWHTCLKWLHYDMIEHGHVDGYKQERFEDENGRIYTKPFFRDWRTPDTVLSDRQEECAKQGPWPREKIPAAAQPIYDQADRWYKFVLGIEDHTFWESWKTNAEAVGDWAGTLDTVIAAMQNCDWSYDGKKETKAPQHDLRL